ncbi:MAG TPA: group 1 truncated hemoglobin [Stellaceae bacterium]|jgi:hemoglobin
MRHRLGGRYGLWGFLLAVGAIAGLLGGSQPGAAGTSLYEALGGKDGLTRLATAMLDIASKDPRTHDQFGNVSFEWLTPRLAAYFCMRVGGPCKYPGRDLHAAHEGLHVSVGEFNAVVEDLQIAMDRQGIPFWTQNRFLALLAPTEHDIVGR